MKEIVFLEAVREPRRGLISRMEGVDMVELVELSRFPGNPLAALA